jgi:DMSO/TMAO reductase YedYZ molybdopterin-dependent catalytic subunit
MTEQKQESKRERVSRLRRVIPILAVGLLCIIAAILVYAHPWQHDASGDDIDWNLTLVGSNGDQRVLSYNEIKDLTPSTGQGGFFTTTGVIHGPYDVKGVSIQDLCNLVGGIEPLDIVLVSATDGYSTAFDYSEVEGSIPTYDPVTIKEVPHEDLILTLMYEQDGKPLSYDDGKPLRLAIAGDDSLLTEGFRWVRWVDRIEVVHQDQFCC